jgi:hypothetical protein
MSVGDGVADSDEGAQQSEEFQRIVLAGKSLQVVRAAGDAQGMPFHKPHGVEGLLRVRPTGQLVDGDDSGMFELSRDLRFSQEASPERRIMGTFGAKFLERDLAAQRAVVCEPDAADSSTGVQPYQAITLTGLGHAVHRFHAGPSFGLGLPG